MPRKLRVSPETFPAISQKWRAAGTDPQSFFNPDGTVNAEFFFTPDVMARAASKPTMPYTEQLFDPACGSGSFLINRTK